MNIITILRDAIERDASDVHLVTGEVPRFRIHGRLGPEEQYGPINTEIIESVIPPDYIHQIREGEVMELDFAYEIADPPARFRVNVFRESNGLAAVFRYIPNEIKSFQELGLPAVLSRVISSLSRGLVLVTGPTGSGKSTTLAAMIDEINSKRAERIITIEDPIEFMHKNKKSFISHRELGKHTKSFADALRAALREDPDVILVGEMRDLETMVLAIHAALTGHLVLSTLHTISAAKTIDRIIEVFPEAQQNQIRADLADTIEMVVSQTLVPMKKGGRIAAYEIMIANTAIRNLIREGKTHQIESAIQVGRGEGMILLDDCLDEIYQKNKDNIDPQEIVMRAKDKERFLPYVGAQTLQQFTARVKQASSAQKQTLSVTESESENEPQKKTGPMLNLNIGGSSG